jgi:hypothetical protein
MALRMAPDGVRALLVMKSKTTGQNYVQTGTITRNGKRLVLGLFRPLHLSLRDITDAAWNKQGILVVGTSTSVNNTSRMVWQVNADGSRLQLLPGSLPDFTAKYVVSNPNKDTLPVVQDDTGHVHWLSRDLLWVAMDSDPGNAQVVTPTYPG